MEISRNLLNCRVADLGGERATVIINYTNLLLYHLAKKRPFYGFKYLNNKTIIEPMIRAMVSGVSNWERFQFEVEFNEQEMHFRLDNPKNFHKLENIKQELKIYFHDIESSDDLDSLRKIGEKLQSDPLTFIIEYTDDVKNKDETKQKQLIEDLLDQEYSSEGYSDKPPGKIWSSMSGSGFQHTLSLEPWFNNLGERLYLYSHRYQFSYDLAVSICKSFFLNTIYDLYHKIEITRLESDYIHIALYSEDEDEVERFNEAFADMFSQFTHFFTTLFLKKLTPKFDKYLLLNQKKEKTIFGFKYHDLPYAFFMDRVGYDNYDLIEKDGELTDKEKEYVFLNHYKYGKTRKMDEDEIRTLLDYFSDNYCNDDRRILWAYYLSNFREYDAVYRALSGLLMDRIEEISHVDMLIDLLYSELESPHNY